jgi:hypothetical protein
LFISGDSRIFESFTILPVVILRDAPDIRPDNPAFIDIRYPAGHQIALPDIRQCQIPDIRLMFI